MEQPLVHNCKLFFLHPFIYEDSKHRQIVQSLLSPQSQWQLKVYHSVKEEDRLRTEYFLPHIIKFLFPTMYCSSTEYKAISQLSVATLQELSSLDFIIKPTILDKYRNLHLSSQSCHYDLILKNIYLKVFTGGVGFLYFEAALDTESITLNDVITVNQLFRPIRPLYQGFSMPDLILKNSHHPISIKALLDELLAEIYHSKIYSSTYNIYMDRLLYYTYICLEQDSLTDNQWIYERLDLLEALRSLNHFYPNQESTHVLSSQEQDTIYYSRHKSSIYGFSKEGGVLLASDRDPSGKIITANINEAYIPNYFSTYYLDTFLLALYQRISLINYCRKLSMIKSILNDKNQIEHIRFEILKFTNTAWFTQITNAELGMSIWKHWFHLFDNDILYIEVKQGLDELDDFLENKRQGRFSLKLGIVTALTIPPTLIFSYVGNQFEDIRLQNLLHPRFIISSFLIFCGMMGILYMVDHFYSRPYK
ncbi:hypothetical protein [Geosporobacter ferrireducens]|uniref:Uncharacterized protein n=1 Tax=Geosporobacter ferrireducens TaxID=1424294 RepID=A0A1D8GFN3_9FIRM|nr:hypothetical protein [Geosporobacter ferrireducens]AOT69718.1 hypothetical protein Gferi_09060 [Geosporobacter ferrireducens]MTI54574.1 hypothetical protein [Geosporobacter ferrireducens]